MLNCIWYLLVIKVTNKGDIELPIVAYIQQTVACESLYNTTITRKHTRQAIMKRNTIHHILCELVGGIGILAEYIIQSLSDGSERLQFQYLITVDNGSRRHENKHKNPHPQLAKPERRQWKLIEKSSCWVNFRTGDGRRREQTNGPSTFSRNTARKIISML